MTIAGDQNLTLTTDLTTNTASVATVDASAATGNVSITSSDTTNAVMTFGSGNDTLVRNIQNSDTAATDSFDGGAGTDTLSVTTGANVAAANMGRYSNSNDLILQMVVGKLLISHQYQCSALFVVLKP